MSRILLLAALAAQPGQALGGQMTQTPTAHYRAFDSRGRQVTTEEIVGALAGADVLFIGETHDDAVAHMLEAELLRLARERLGPGAGGQGRTVALALEMFEADVQVVLNEYLAGLISERHFLLSSRPWKNYDPDYRPLVEYARAQGMEVVASNAPARYVNRVSTNGPDSLARLSLSAKSWLPPLPYAPASREYAEKFQGFLQGETARAQASAQTAESVRGQTPAAPAQNPHGAHGGASYLLDAQNLRDASMAYRVAEFLGRNRGALVVHVNGTFHSEGRLGVPEHLSRYRPKSRSVVVTILRGAGYPEFDAARHGGLGDFVVLTDPALTRPA